MLRQRPANITITLLKSISLFEPLLINVEREFLTDTTNLAEFVKLLKDFYAVVHPAYGEAHIEEMTKLPDSPLGRKWNIGIDLKRALPDIYWANFLGPEYVSMFGMEKVLSAPVHSAEPLPDGGALLILSKSPLDYLSERGEIEKRQFEVKKYLGFEAFDTGDISYKGKVPTFRFLGEKEHEQQQLVARKQRSTEVQSDWLSQVSREEWVKWIENNRSIALELVLEMESKAVKLDFSGESLSMLDNYLERLGLMKVSPSMNFLQKIAAYVSQILIKNLDGRLSFEDSEDIPSLRLGRLQVSTLARAQKVILEGEKFEPWYRYLTEELRSAPSS
jgi:hypothetical protein